MADLAAERPTGNAEASPTAAPLDTSKAAWRAFGTNVDLVVTGGDLDVARGAVESLLAEVDRALSRFRPDSELVALNQRAGQAVIVSPFLAVAIHEALRAAALTDGLCDPTVGRALRSVGYDGDFMAIATRTDPIVLQVQAIPGWRTIEFDEARRTVLARPGVELDLGATGKALAADLAAAAAVAAMGGGGALVSLGGDLAVAGGAPAGGWRFLAVEDSNLPPDSPGEVVRLAVGGVATSSTTIRQWSRGGVRLHHIVDPRTGLPAVSPWRTVSVIAATCVEANAAATAALIRGLDGPAWLTALGLPARFVRTDGDVLRVGGWPVPDA